MTEVERRYHPGGISRVGCRVLAVFRPTLGYTLVKGGL